MKILFTSLVVLFLCSTTVNAQNYNIDASHSNVQISVERFGVVNVSGRFKAVEGKIYYNKADASKTNANAAIKVDSYDANNIGGEQAVKSKAFLDAEGFPKITFIGSKAIEKEGKMYLIGALTIHGVTKTIELPFSIKGPLLDLPTQKQSIAFNASITINRQDYGIAFDRKLPNGTSLVGNDVEITLSILAIAE
ncbi:MAG: polyisoprenoid-binding protein [Winogradskyella sp.]|uniref:YceI family protein n=1 Tax=Winogradskyella sp. TaxID=1883156 RepID=UPI000F3E9FE4|nr:YceI family protein [Winogradskyella sp.]RNC87851.1 MAG: polyisoprenoid-binding protein [Winogradskyella sp.]